MKTGRRKRLVGIAALALAFLFLKSSLAETHSHDAPGIHGAETPSEDMPVDCSAGRSVGGSVPIERYCYERLQDSISQRVKTVAGMLLVRDKKAADQQDTLWLDLKKLASAEWITLDQGLPEEKGASLFIANISPIPYSPIVEDADIGNRFNHLYLHIVDVGVTPPFISEKRLPITGVRDENGDRGLLDVRKIDEDTFIISGETLPEKNSRKSPEGLSVEYSRKDRKVSVLQL